MGGPLALLTGKVLRDRAPQRYGELRRELALSGRIATPQPPSGESEEDGGDAEDDASPAPAPQPMTYPRSMGGPLAPLCGAGQHRGGFPVGSQKRHMLLTLFLALSGSLAALAGPEADLAVWVFLRVA